jgi:hypothetical protein
MKKLLFLIIVGLGILLAATSVSADTFKYYLDYQFTTDGTDPAGDPPWLTAEIRDDGVDEITNWNKVRITMSTDDLKGSSEFVGAWYFNWDFDGEYATEPIAEGTTGPTMYSGDVNDDGNIVAGSRFDISFDFPESDAPFKDRFGPGETVIYQFMGDGLMASNFNVKDTTNSYYSAAHVQGISEGDIAVLVEGIGEDEDDDASGWIGATRSIPAIPEPSTILLLGAGLASMFGIRRFKFKK